MTRLKKNLFECSVMPISMASFINIVLFILSYIIVQFDFSSLLRSMIWIICCGFISLIITSNSKKALIVILSSVIIQVIYYTMTNNTFGMALILLFVVLLSLLSNKFDLLYSFIVLVFLSAVLGILLGITQGAFQYVLKLLASAIKNKSAIFSILNEGLQLIFGDDFSFLFYHTDFGGSNFINGRIVTGAVDIFSATKDNPTGVTSDYLTGKYYTNLFFPIGIALAFYNKLKEEHRFALIISMLMCIICGDNSIFSIFVILYNPLVFITYVLLSGVSNIVCRLVDIRIGFENSASIIELICYFQKPVYFFLIGVVFVGMMYFVCQYIISKYSFNDMRYIPKNIRRILNSLGGEDNIEKISDGFVYVYNPNLIDVLKLDCIINNNQVELIENDFEELLKYK